MIKSLQDCKIVITRPQTQALNLSKKIHKLGGQPLIAPTLEIQDYPPTPALLPLLQNLAQQHLAIFISANAVEKTLALLQKHQVQWPTTLPIAVIGPGTRQRVEQAGLTVRFCPTHDFNSEGLLALADLQTLNGKNILLFRGLGGREFLAEQLRSRGANVEEVLVYQRVTPTWTFSELFPDWQTQPPQIIICTSNTGLQNLWDKAGKTYQPQLQAIPFIVASERMRRFATALGLQSVIVAASATDDALVEAVIRWRNAV